MAGLFLALSGEGRETQKGEGHRSNSGYRVVDSRLREYPAVKAVHLLAIAITKMLGPEDCRERGVGLMRKEIAAVRPSNVIDAGAREQMVALLESHCRLCKGCSLGVMPRKPRPKEPVRRARAQD
jgi:hypothetical protein